MIEQAVSSLESWQSQVVSHALIPSTRWSQTSGKVRTQSACSFDFMGGCKGLIIQH